MLDNTFSRISCRECTETISHCQNKFDLDTDFEKKSVTNSCGCGFKCTRKKLFDSYSKIKKIKLTHIYIKEIYFQ